MQFIVEAADFAASHDIAVKLPMTGDRLTARRLLARKDRTESVTRRISACEAIAAAAPGAASVSPFVGRPDGKRLEAMKLIVGIRQIYDNYEVQTRILPASIRTMNHVRDGAKLGADAAATPPAALRALARHPLTGKGQATFLAAPARTGQTTGTS